MNRSDANPGIHRFAVLLSGCVVFLIAAGGLVKSLEAGLSVPDWPLSYGTLNPPRWWEIETVRAEHGHRLIAGTVALMTVALAAWVALKESRRWVRRLAWAAVAAVLAQALLGGITVLFFLPTPVSVSHAALAELFLCTVATLALVTSGWWRLPRPAAPELRPVARLASWFTGLVFVQVLLGAVVRHTGAGLAIPDFPLAFGRLIPPRFDVAIGIHFSHRVGALLVLLAAAWLLVRAAGRAKGERFVVGVSGLLGLLVLAQATLGASVVLTGRAVLPNTLHVPTGALVLAAGAVLSVACWRRVLAAPGGAAEPAVGDDGARLSEVAR